jgi:serine/threonine protein kinase
VPKVFLATLKTSYECGIEEEAANEMRRLRNILSMQKHMAHPSLVKTLYVTARNEPAEVLVYATERKFKIHCIVQELCEGGDLYSYLMAGSSGKPFSEPIACYFFSQLMQGVAVLHSRALYHMDIKIENVLVAKDRATGAYSIRLGDFGSMRSFAASSQSKQDTKDVHLVQAKDLGVIPPELLKMETSKRGRKYLGFDQSTKLLDPAKADIWSAGYLLLNLVAVQACMRHRLLFPAPRIDRKEGSRWTQLVAELKASPIAKDADGNWNRDILDFLQDKTVIVEEQNAEHEVVRSSPIGNEALTASPELLDLLRSMLHSDPQQRPCASEVLRHPWLQWDHKWCPSEQVVINDMNSRKKPGTQADTQVYEFPPACTFGSASEVFALLERAVHGWAVELTPQELLLSINLAGHIVVCRVLPHVEGQPWKIHCKWENGKISASWLGMYLDLKARLDYIVKTG